MNIQTAADLLDWVKHAKGLTKDTQLAIALNWSQPRVSNYRRGVSMLDETALLELADYLGEDPGFLLMLGVQYRAQTGRARQIYREIARSLNHESA